MIAALLVFAFASRLGIGMECLDRDLWDPEPAYAHLSDLGIRHARLQSGWARTEKEKGRYDFAWLDGIVNELVRRGVEPWISLSYGNPIYAAACDGEQSYTGQKMNPLHSPDGLAAWQAYVRAIVKRYGAQVKVWEVWNEPDCTHFFKPLPGKTWMEEYVELLRITSEAVRAVQPDARIAVCTAAGPDVRLRQTIRLFELGAGRYADVYTFHAYNARPEDFTRTGQDAFYGAIRRHAPKIEFWRGEAGLSSKNSGRGALSDIPLSEETQARWMSRHLVRDLADPEISLTSYFHLFDFDHYTHEVTYHYGVLRDKDYSRKPSFAVLQRIKRLFDDGNAKPDRLMNMTMTPLKGATSEEAEFVGGAVIHTFRRHGVPMIAYSASSDVTVARPEVKCRALAFFGNGDEVWKDPVVFDLVDGSIVRPPFRKDWPEPKLELPVRDHMLVLTEAAALAPHYSVGEAKATPAANLSVDQVNHE